MEMFIFGIIIFLVIKLSFFTLFSNKKFLQYLKIFAIASLSALTASVFIWFLIFWLRLKFFSSWLIAPAILIIIESIFYCKFDKERKKYEVILIVILVNFFAVALSSPFLLSIVHRPDKQMLRISCTSNLKQIGLSLKQYAMDYDDWFPDKSGPVGFEKLRSKEYLTDCRVYSCPSCKGYKEESN